MNQILSQERVFTQILHKKCKKIGISNLIGGIAKMNRSDENS